MFRVILCIDLVFYKSLLFSNMSTATIVFKNIGIISHIMIRSFKIQFSCFILRIQEWFVLTCDICDFNSEYNPCMFLSVNVDPRFFRLVRYVLFFWLYFMYTVIPCIYCWNSIISIFPP